MATDSYIGTTTETAAPSDEWKPRNTPQQVKLWQERVSIAKRELDDWARTSGANRFVDEYNGKFEIFFNGLKGKIPVPPINAVFAYVQADVANTYNRDPYIAINPKAGTVLGAKLWEVIVNYHWRKGKTKDEVEPEIIDKDLVGYGGHKVGYEVETEGAEEDLKILREGLYSARVDWKDLVWNLGAKKPPRDCMWMAQRIVKPLSYIKRKYPAAAKLEGTQNPELDKAAYDTAQYKDDIKVAVLWEIWDAENREILLIAEGMGDKWLAPPQQWPEYMEEFPFMMYWDFYAPGKSRPMSAIAPWEAQVLEEMILLAAAVNHHKRWNRQMLVKKGSVSSNDLDKVERGDDGAIIDYTGTGDLDKNVKFFDWGQLPTDFFLLMDRLAALRRDVSGQPEFERGGVTKTSTRTQSELQMIKAGAKGRSDRRVDRFETHLENIARHMMMHLKANFDFEETVRIVGGTPEEVIQALGNHYDPITQTVTFTPDEIAGEYEAEIKAGSTLPLDRETRLEILQSVLNMLAAVDPAALASPVISALIQEILDEYDIKSLEEAFKMQMEMQQQQQAAEEQSQGVEEQKSKAEAAKRVAQTEEIATKTDIMVDQEAERKALGIPPVKTGENGNGKAH